MALFRTFALTLIAFAAAGCAPAQPRPGDRPCAPDGAASGPMHRCGPGHHARWGSDDTPGWSMMTADEQLAHRQRMATFGNEQECRAYMDRHREDMMARAKAKGLPPPTRPRQDACSALKAGARSP